MPLFSLALKDNARFFLDILALIVNFVVLIFVILISYVNCLSCGINVAINCMSVSFHLFIVFREG